MTWISQDTPRPIICGHRGAPAVVAENTLASFSTAVERGATWVEFDVRPTADGQLIIHHDPDTESGQDIAKTTAAELDASIPTFGDLVQQSPSLGLDIEMKTDSIPLALGDFAELVIAQINQHRSSIDDLIITSFDAEALAHVRDQAPEIATGLLYWKGRDDVAIQRAVADGHVAIAPWIRLISKKTMAKAAAESLAVMTWTVNSPRDIVRARNLGVDMIIGDDPAAIAEHL